MGIYSNDNLSIDLSFPDGSICTIQYLANGSQILSKEDIEVFAGGKSAILDDFRSLHLFARDIRNRYRNVFRQDKGHANAWNAFTHSIINRNEPPIPEVDLIAVGYAALAAEKSRQTGKEVILSEFIQ